MVDLSAACYTYNMASRGAKSQEFTDRCMTDYKQIFCNGILKGKVAFVTGGGSGIGFTIAEVFMRHGCDVAIASRNFARLEYAKRTLEAAVPGRKCFIAQMDVRKPEQVTECVRKILAEYNRLDILVNNSAGNFLCPADSLSSNAYRNVIDIDTVGTYTVSKAVYSSYFKKHGGVIINITATLHVNGQVLQSHAGSAKAAIEALTKHLAVEWGPNNIRIACVAPGPIGDTVGYSKLGGSVVSEEEIARSIPLQKIGRRVDIANTVLYMVSDAAGLVTGTTLIADGGSVLTGCGFERMIQLMGKTPKL